MARVYGRDTARDSAVPPGGCYHLQGLKNLRVEQLLKPRENNSMEKAVGQE